MVKLDEQISYNTVSDILCFRTLSFRRNVEELEKKETPEDAEEIDYSFICTNEEVRSVNHKVNAPP